MRYRVLLIGLSSLSILCLPNALTQQSEISEQIRVKLVEMDVRVTNLMGKPVEGLTSDDFVVRENGKRREVDSFDEIYVEKTPPALRHIYRPRVMLLIDFENTVRANMIRVFPQLAELVERISESESEVGIAINANGVQLIQDFTSDARVLREAVAFTEEVYDQAKGKWAFSDPSIIQGNDADNLGERAYLARHFTRQLRHLNLFVNYLGAYYGSKSVIMVSDAWYEQATEIIDPSLSPGLADASGRAQEYNAETIAKEGRPEMLFLQGVDDITTDALDLKKMREIQSSCLNNKVTVNVVNTGRRGLGHNTRALAGRTNDKPGFSQQEELAALTGGFHYRPNNKGIATMIHRVITQSEHYYRLRFYSTDEKEGFRRIRVSVKGMGRNVYTVGGYDSSAQDDVTESAVKRIAATGADGLAVDMDTQWVDWYPISPLRNRAYLAISRRAYDTEGKLLMEQVTSRQLTKKGRSNVQINGTIGFEIPPDAEVAKLEVIFVDMISGQRVVVSSDDDASAS